MRPGPIGIGLRAQRGGAVVVGVRIGAGEPELAVSTFVATHAPDDALAQAPFAAAYDLVHQRRAPRGDAEALVAEGRRRQDAAAAEGLSALAERLGAPLSAALLVNRAGWIDDLLGHAIGWADHVPVVEGLAVREALRFGLHEVGVAAIEIDEKLLADVAAGRLGLPAERIDAVLKALGITAGKPWRKEQKAAALAGWIAAA